MQNDKYSVRLKAILQRLSEDKETLLTLIKRNETNTELITFVLEKYFKENEY